jgi:DNA primase
MNKFISKEKIKEIQNRADIYEVVSSYIQLKKYGKSWKSLCPFHQEKSPSFVVSLERQTFNCFGCGKSGNVFQFIMNKENVGFVEAAYMLANRFGVNIPETNYSNNSSGREDRLYSIHRKLAESYNANLYSEAGKPALEYLYSRGVTDEDIDKFQLGFAPDSWNYAIMLLFKCGYKKEELVYSGIVVEKKESGRIYDRFRNRIMFPILNEQGSVAAFSARTTDENYQGVKYVNSPETEIFKKSKILYALPLAGKAIKEKDFAVLCEGQLDVIAMHRAGFKNTVAPQGTAFSNEQADHLKRCTDKVYICFDGDKAGIEASDKVIDILLSKNMEVRVIDLPSGEDPDGIIINNGKLKIEQLVNTAPDFFDYMIKKLALSIDMNSPYGKDRLANIILNKLAIISNGIVRSVYIEKLADYLSVPSQTVFSELDKINNN